MSVSRTIPPTGKEDVIELWISKVCTMEIFYFSYNKHNIHIWGIYDKDGKSFNPTLEFLPLICAGNQKNPIIKKTQNIKTSGKKENQLYVVNLISLFSPSFF